ncbi:glycosyl transferase [Candidatus Nomurabacteria bacterium]|nr:glycosyl transferase [Candidatus Nomurabacteria bacterium]
MIVTEIYNGQGLGNQLWCYVVTRVIAEDKGYDFGIMHPEKFKCLDFMNLDFGKVVNGGTGPEGGPPTVLPNSIQYYYAEKEILHPITKADIRTYDNDLVNIKDHTKIDGYMQDEKYIIHKKEEIRNWLKIRDGYENLNYSNNNICIINFRGGEYVGIRNVFLPQKYWDDAILNMKKINPEMEFVVVTDDTITAKRFFPKFKISHESIGSDYSIINNAYYLILSNSSFAFFPTWLNQKVKKVIAPKYWSQYNTSDGYWGLGYNITKNWIYLDRAGIEHDYDTCIEDLNKYNNGEKDLLFFFLKKK